MKGRVATTDVKVFWLRSDGTIVRLRVLTHIRTTEQSQAARWIIGLVVGPRFVLGPVLERSGKLWAWPRREERAMASMSKSISDLMASLVFESFIFERKRLVDAQLMTSLGLVWPHKQLPLSMEHKGSINAELEKTDRPLDEVLQFILSIKVENHCNITKGMDEI